MNARHPLPLVLLAVLAAALLVPTSLSAAEPGAGAIVGTWLTEPAEPGGRARVKIERRGEELIGRIVWLEEPKFPADGPRPGQPKVDLENPDPDLRDRPIVGLRILDGFTHAGDGEWTGGTIYDPANGKTYKARLRLQGRDTLDVRGYVGVPLLGRTTTWRRVE